MSTTTEIARALWQAPPGTEGTHHARRAVLDTVIPAAVGLIETAIASGQMRPVDPELTLRSVIGPVALHLLLSEVFGIRPADGLALDRLVENHLDILFNGLFLPEVPTDV